jgi:hypothetical protein
MSQPGTSTTPRVRLWWLLKGLGAAVVLLATISHWRTTLAETTDGQGTP